MAEYFGRKTLNAQYSERAFARSLGLSAGFLKLLFQGKKRLSVKRAQEIVGKLNWTEPRRIRFLKSVKTNSPTDQKLLDGKFLLQDSDFFEISDWFHFAIVELIKVKNGSVNTEQLFAEFFLSPTEMTYALKHLTRIGLIEKVGESKYKVADKYEMPSISSASIRKYHRQTLTLALQAIENQNIEQRDLRGLTLAFDRSRLNEAKKDVQKFVSAFEKKYGSGAVDSVYQLNLALFQLNRGKV